MELIQTTISIATLVFVLSSMLATGLGLTVSEITTPLRNARLVLLSLLANFVLMPLAAVALAATLRLDQPLGVGLLLLGTAAGAPFLPKLAQIAKGNLAFGVGLMVLLMVVTVGYLPLVLPLLLPGVSVNPAQIARSLFLLMLLPLAGALVVRARFAPAAARTKPVLDRVSNLSLILLIVLITVTNINNVLAVFGTRGILAALLFLASGFWRRVVARRTRRGHAAGPGPRHCATQHRRRARGGRSEFQRPESGRHDHRRCHRRAAGPDAVVQSARAETSPARPAEAP